MKYLLPAAGVCYHLSKDGKLPLYSVKIRTWSATDKKPEDYRPCKRCEKKTKKEIGLKD